MQEERYELLRTTSRDEASFTAQLLKDAGVPHKLSTNVAGAEITEIGRADFPKDILITVASEYSVQARGALEAAYAKTKLPAGHFLLTATDEDLLEVLGNPWEWSAFDVVHARIMARERGIEESVIEEHRGKLLASPAHGRKASKTLIVVGYVSAFLGGLVGVLIGYSLAFTMEQTPERNYHRYDEASRREGRRIFVIGLLMVVAIRFILAIHQPRI